MKRELDQLQLDFDTSRLELVHASQTITMSDPSATALRQKKDSSITVAAELLKDRRRPYRCCRRRHCGQDADA